MSHNITGRPISTMISILSDAVEMAGGQRALSRKTGIPQSNISAVLGKKRPMTTEIVNALGYVTHTVCIPMQGQNR